MISLDNGIEIFKINKKLELDQLKNKVEEKYELQITRIEKNNESTDGNVYDIFTEKERYILKVYESIKHSDSMSKLLEFLEKNKFNVPEIIRSNKNDAYTKFKNKKYLMLYSFVEGKKIDDLYKKLPNNLIITLATELKRFHDSTKKLNNINLNKINTGDTKLLRCSVLHFDLTRSNIFYNENRKIFTFIDFDDAKFGPSIIDVAIIIANLFFSKTRGIDIDGIKTFIDFYYKNNLKLKIEEVPLINEMSIKWINYILNGNKFDSSTIESLEARKKLISKIDFNNI